LRRKYRFAKRGIVSRPWTTRIRVLAGAAIPMILWSAGSAQWFPVLVAGVLTGEFVDRFEFYIETVESR